VSLSATTYETERFRQLLSRRIGLGFDDAKLAYLGEVLRRRIDECGRDCTAYLQALEHEPSPGELSVLAGELTVGETYFFRNHEQFQALAEVVLPERAALPPAQKTLRLLSAGCSSGEEAYSMAIVARETGGGASCRLAIRAVDVNPLALQKARRARYSAWALRETRQDIRDRWFRVDGREMVLDDSIRAMVAVEAANIASDDAALW
jgi:chemotaxis protein methyltransferase CheR